MPPLTSTLPPHSSPYIQSVYTALHSYYIAYPTLSSIVLLIASMLLSAILLPEITNDLLRKKSKSSDATTSLRSKQYSDATSTPLLSPKHIHRASSSSSQSEQRNNPTSSTASPLRTKRNVQLSPLSVNNEQHHQQQQTAQHMSRTQPLPAHTQYHDEPPTYTNTMDATPSALHQQTTMATPVSQLRMSYSRDNSQDINDPTTNTDTQAQLMCEGATFLKFGRFGKPHPRRLSMRMHQGQLQLYWQTGDLLVDQIVDVVAGKQTGVYNRRENRMADADLCFSIVTKKRTLDLQADTREQRDTWVNGVKRLANIYDSPHQQQRDTSAYNKEASQSSDSASVVNVSSSSNQYINAVLNQYPAWQQTAVQVAMANAQFPAKPKHSRIGSISNKLSVTRTRNKSISNNNSQLIDNTSSHTPRQSETRTLAHMSGVDNSGDESDSRSTYSMPLHVGQYGSGNGGGTADIVSPPHGQVGLTQALKKQSQLLSPALSPVHIGERNGH